MTNGIVAIGGLLALAVIKSKLGSGIRLFSGIYLENRIPLVEINKLIEGEEEKIFLFEKFAQFFLSKLNSNKYQFSHTTELSDAEIDFCKSRFSYVYENQYLFKIKDSRGGEIFGLLSLESCTHIDLDLFAYIDGGDLYSSKNYFLLRLFTDHIFDILDSGDYSNQRFKDLLPPDLKIEFDRTALELNRYLNERYRENMKDLMNLPSNWDTFLADLNRGDVHTSEYDLLGFYPDSLYVFTKKVHKANSPYDLFNNTEKRKSKLRRR